MHRAISLLFTASVREGGGRGILREAVYVRNVGRELEQKSIIPKVYTHIFSVSHPNGFAIDHYCGRAFLHLVLAAEPAIAVV